MQDKYKELFFKEMESKIHENCIITGIADSFCLSCENYLNIDDLSEHIDSLPHKDALKSTSYVEKYNDDFIRKVKLGYYCELCNVIIKSLLKIRIHVTNIEHINNKTKRLLKSLHDGIVVFDKIFISKQAWHGLSDGSCVICNVDYEDEDDHLKNSIHVINLIQSKLELKNDNLVYRLIDETMVSCLICNKLITKECKETHINDPQHLNNYSKCKENNCLNIQKDTTEEKSLEDISKENDKTKDDENAVGDVIDPKLVAVKSTELLTEKKDTHIKKYKTQNKKKEDDTKLLSPIESLQQIKKFAKENNMKYKRNSTYCKLCDVRFSSSLKMMKEHVLETKHKDKLNEKVASKNMQYTRMLPMFLFIDSAVWFEHYFDKNIVINKKFCMSFHSFNMIGESASRMRCHACELSMIPLEVLVHTETDKHVKAMRVTSVILDHIDEFIREVRPGVYHCGTCNFCASKEDMSNHLKSINHSETKSLWNALLIRYKPRLLEHLDRERRMDNIIRMVFNSF